MKKKMFGMMLLIGMTAVAAPQAAPSAAGREAFMKQQALAETQRLGGMLDVLESNQNALAERVRKLEGGGGEVASLRADIEALKADLNRLRTEMQNQRREIVADIVKKINEDEKKRARNTPVPAPQPTEARGTYTVQPGDTLSLIAQAFGTNVGRLKEMNNLRNDNLRVGQKLTVPEPGSNRRR